MTCILDYFRNKTARARFQGHLTQHLLLENGVESSLTQQSNVRHLQHAFTRGVHDPSIISAVLLGAEQWKESGASGPTYQALLTCLAEMETEVCSLRSTQVSQHAQTAVADVPVLLHVHESML